MSGETNTPGPKGIIAPTSKRVMTNIRLVFFYRYKHIFFLFFFSCRLYSTNRTRTDGTTLSFSAGPFCDPPAWDSLWKHVFEHFNRPIYYERLQTLSTALQPSPDAGRFEGVRIEPVPRESLFKFIGGVRFHVTRSGIPAHGVAVQISCHGYLRFINPETMAVVALLYATDKLLAQKRAQESFSRAFCECHLLFGHV